MIHDEFSHIASPSRRWRLRHPGAQQKFNAAWRAKHPNYQKEWDAKNPEKLRDYNKKWNRLNPEKRKSIMEKHDAKRRSPERLAYKRGKVKEVREKVFEMYGHTCSTCGFSDKRALQLDHVKNNGAEHRRGLTGGQNRGSFRVWKDAVAEYRPDIYQILCANCNWIKRSEIFIVKSAAA